MAIYTKTALDNACHTATAFPEFETMVKACRGGYIPSLRAAQTDELPIARAKFILAAELRARGFAVGCWS